MSKLPIALQMYTLRDAQQSDFAGTLKQVAALGYRGVELAGTGGLTAFALKALLQDLHLQPAGSHISLAALTNNLDTELDYNEELGNRYMVCPWLPENVRNSAEAYRTLAAQLTAVGARCSERGMQLCYHNHAFEFDRFDRTAGFDILFDTADPDLVMAELDTYWAEFGGESPTHILRKLTGRVPLVHLKDMANDESRRFTEVGEGRMDFDAIIAAAVDAGTKWLIVEQDVCTRPPLESVEISLRNLQRMGYA